MSAGAVPPSGTVTLGRKVASGRVVVDVGGLQCAAYRDHISRFTHDLPGLPRSLTLVGPGLQHRVEDLILGAGILGTITTRGG